MTPQQLLADLAAAGAFVSVDPSGLRVQAPPGVLAANRRAIEEHRDALLALVGTNGADRTGEAMGNGDVDLEQHVANALALSVEEQAAWRREIVHALVWAEAGRGQDAHLAGDLGALRRIVVPGRCLRCDAPSPADGRHWCDACASEYPKTTEVKP